MGWVGNVLRKGDEDISRMACESNPQDISNFKGKRRITLGESGGSANWEKLE